MEIIEINRTSGNHKYHRGNIMVTYDEAVLISEALYNVKSSKGEELWRKWQVFADVLCHGQYYHHPEMEKEK